jgi:hypothetical protein
MDNSASCNNLALKKQIEIRETDIVDKHGATSSSAIVACNEFSEF